MAKKKEETSELTVPVKVHVQAGTGHLIFHVDDAKVIKKLTSGAVHECSLTFNDPTVKAEEASIGGDGGDKPPHP